MSYHSAASRELNRILKECNGTLYTDASGIKLRVPVTNPLMRVIGADELELYIDDSTGMLVQRTIDEFGRDIVDMEVFNTAGKWEKLLV